TLRPGHAGRERRAREAGCPRDPRDRGSPRRRPARPRVLPEMTFGHPLLLLTLLLVPVAIVAYRLATRRRMEYAVRYTNVDVLAAVVATGRPWRRWLMAGAFLLALATLCAALSRPHVHRVVVNDNATVVLV